MSSDLIARAIARAKDALRALETDSYGGSAEAGALAVIHRENRFISDARALMPELLAVVESVDALAVKWENATSLTDGQPNIVARAFAADLRNALESRS
jgi:hypothetical protein